MDFSALRLDHVGIRVTELATAEAFYARLDFDATTNFQPQTGHAASCTLTGLRLHLIYNGIKAREGNVLMDAAVKHPGYTHAAFVIANTDALVAWLASEGIAITQGPLVMGEGRRKVCFIRDPDRNVLEFNELLDA
jgi:catechol 2,3-dioxygenase-like lactoylglutathione lyase family enzyme